MQLDQRGRIVFSTERDAALTNSGTSTTTAAGTRFEYGPFGVLASITDIAGNRSRTTYDRLGRPLERDDADRGHRSYSYTVFGDADETVRAGNERIKYHYDAVGRIGVVESATFGNVTYAWDTAAFGVGKLAGVSDPAGHVTSSYQYDSVGRPIAKSWNIDGAAYTIWRGYDSTGRLETITYPAIGGRPPTAVRYEYGRNGQLLTASDSQTRALFWRWLDSDASGGFSAEQLGNGLTEVRTENPAKPGVLRTIQTLDSQAHALRKLTFDFDAELNLETRTDEIGGTTESFEYTAQNQLKRWTWNGTAGKRVVRWDYDDIGNLTLRAIEAGPGSNVSFKYDQTVAGPHQPSSSSLGGYRYDTKGNQVAAPNRLVTYSAFDLPLTIERADGTGERFWYDDEHRRVRSHDSATGMIVDAIGDLYEYRHAHGSSDGEHRLLIEVDGRPLARRIVQVTGANQSERVEYLHADHLGSIDLVSGADGKIVEVRRYEPYGRRIDPADPARAPSATSDIGFTAQSSIEEVGLVDMKGRFYDPFQARFLTPDPLLQRTERAQSLNRYAYGFHNPLRFRDSTGFAAEDADGGSPDTTYINCGDASLAPDCDAGDEECEKSHVVVGDVPHPPPSTSGAGPSGAPQSTGGSGSNSGRARVNDDGLGGVGIIVGSGVIDWPQSSLPAPIGPGRTDYYGLRQLDYLRRHVLNDPLMTPVFVTGGPRYYLEYGMKYLTRFYYERAPQLGVEGQRWLEGALVNLQRAIEQRRAHNPKGFARLEENTEAFREFAFKTHARAYKAAGIREVGLVDGFKIAITPDFRDVFNWAGLSQIVDVGLYYFNYFVPEFLGLIELGSDPY
jgi:RHS repeat-associated protein